MGLRCVRVIRQGAAWGVTESADCERSDLLAVFEDREDAFDYARSIAIASEESILEGEDELGELHVRQRLSTDESGIIRLTSIGLGGEAIASLRGIAPKPGALA